ncbi:MAG: putative sensor domain DACNV-containing protein [Janthinobacterium lividum]
MPPPKLRYYPANLAAELLARWPAAGAPLPPAAPLEEFIAVAYQASLLAEEGQPVRCRLLLRASLAELPDVAAGGPCLLALSAPRPYDEQQIRRLSPALHTAGSLLVVRPDAADNLLIWALLHSAAPSAEEAPRLALPAPAALLLYVRGPGNLVFYCGSQRVLTLHYGRVEGHGFVDYPVAWSHGRFAENITALDQLLAPGVATQPPVLDLAGELAHRVVRRVVARVRASGHGGMLAFVPQAALGQMLGPEATLRPKYPVQQPATPAPYLTLLVALLTRLTELGDLSWAFYQQADDARLRELGAAVDQFADQLADLMTVDGAVAVTKQLALVGFGVEVYAPHLHLPVVYRALDATADQVQAEAADSGGTRHRAAYRLCLAEPASMAIVVSQDGGVRFVHHQAGRVVFWEQLTV